MGGTGGIPLRRRVRPGGMKRINRMLEEIDRDCEPCLGDIPVSTEALRQTRWLCGLMPADQLPRVRVESNGHGGVSVWWEKPGYKVGVDLGDETCSWYIEDHGKMKASEPFVPYEKSPFTRITGMIENLSHM